MYSGLESIYKKYKDKGFAVLAFPANNFAHQEPGTNSEIKAFCAKRNVTFDLFAKVSAKGDDQCPLYKFLTTYPDDSIAGRVTWNFQKYLVARDGTVVARFGPRAKPESDEIVGAIEKALKVKTDRRP